MQALKRGGSGRRQLAVAAFEIAEFLRIQFGARLGYFLVKIGWELGADVQQLAVGEAQNDGRGKVQLSDVEVLETIHRGGIVRPDFDAAIEVGIGSAEGIRAGNGAQQTR